MRVKEGYGDMVFLARASGIKAKSADDLEMLRRGVLKDREDERKFG